MPWLVAGSFFGSSDTWQLIINTSTTIVTYLAAFSTQKTQNAIPRRSRLKLDELINSMKGARNRLVDVQNFSNQELEVLQKQFQRLDVRASRGVDVAVAAKENPPR